MKRTILLLSCAFFATLSFSTSAQIFVGPKAGINFNSFRQSKEYKNHFDVVPSFNIGGFAKYPVLPYLNARVELLYFQQAANIYDYTVMSDLRRTNAKVRFHNIEVPVLAELGLPSLAEDILQPKVLLGGFYSYTLFSRESYINVVDLAGSPEVTFDGYLDGQSQYYRSQFGLIAALAAEMKIFSHPVSVEFRYQYNLNKINKPGTQHDYNLKPTTDKWGSTLLLHTLSINVGVQLYNF